MRPLQYRTLSLINSRAQPSGHERKDGPLKIQAQIDALESLDIIDRELAELDGELSSEREALEEKKGQLRELDGRIAASRASIEDMERTRNELMQEVRQMSLQVDRSREKLSRSRTEREANAAQREVEEITKLYRDREGEIDKLVQLITQARSDVDETTGQREALASELGASEGDVTTKLGELEKKVADLQARRKESMGSVQKSLYRRYDLIRKRRGTGIAHTTEGTCSACHMMLPPMTFQKLMRGEDFEQCPSCNRIIYFRPGGDPAAEEAVSES